MRIFALIAAVLFSCAALLAPGRALAAGNSALVLRTGVQGADITRVVIETSARPAYRIGYMHSAARVVVDIEDCDTSKIENEELAKGLVKDVRAGRLESGVARFVVELAAPAEVELSSDGASRGFVLNPFGEVRNYRLVLDLKKTSDERFAKLSEAGSSTPRALPQAAPDKKPAGQPARKPARKVIVIDPGHGGSDPGTLGAGGMKEKDITLSAARILRDKLKANPDYEVLMTRDSDVFVPLRARAEFGEKHGARLFISIHADSSPRRAARGFSIYTLNDKATDEEAKKIAEKENAADLMGVGTFDTYDPVTKNILGDLLQTQVRIASNELAGAVVAEVRKEVPCIDNPHREAPFIVLRSSIPSVLSEIGFLSNKDEAQLLSTRAYQERVAAGIARAVARILKD